jgi:23S rRNA (adenine2503-C2)-methyltransferase
VLHNKKINILNLYKKNLLENLNSLGFKRFQIDQILDWIYQKGIKKFSEMTNVSKKNIAILEENFDIELPDISNFNKSSDDTIKFLIKFMDCREVECVYIPETSRATLCISSQVGCTLSCKFCHTGTQTFVRNLEHHEMIAQILTTKNIINDWQNPKLTNLVFMGMGEPFFNYENILKAIEIICDEKYLNFSRKKITVSTSGLVPEIIKASTEIRTNLAISLHAPNDEIRSEIMAINKKYPLNELMHACKIYNKENPEIKITFEYVMLKDINDKDEHATQLAKLINKYNINAKVNLIPFNSWDNSGFECSNQERIINFKSIIQQHKILTTIRKNRGDDVMGACGQLKSLSQRVKNTKK